MQPGPDGFAERVHGLRALLTELYGVEEGARLLPKLFDIVSEYREKAALNGPARAMHPGRWSARDVVVITYGNSIRNGSEPPLETLSAFLSARLGSLVSTVHVLPFFPFSSDDGFSVIDFHAVDPLLGDWADLRALGRSFAVMADLVINHVSRESLWFMDFVNDREPGRNYFITHDPELDLTGVVRPRNTPLLVPVHTYRGLRHVWATFSEDQIDLDFANPAVLLEMVRVLCHYLSEGMRLIRLDAIAYLWKEVGTPCIHHPHTHDVVRVLRLVTELSCDPESDPALLVSETNVPHAENISYFGQGDEAHLVYQFPLAPLALHALTAGTSRYLMQWGCALEPPPEGCAFLNFTASHDGIGLRPAEGLVPEPDVDTLVELMHAFGGFVSMRMLADGTQRPYEINISLFDALRGTFAGEDAWQVERFICSQVLTLCLQGVPALYIHSLLATPNDLDGVERSGRTRSINRRQWELADIDQLLLDGQTSASQVFAALTELLRLRRAEPAFSPAADQRFVKLADACVSFVRGRGADAIAVVINVTPRSWQLGLADREALDCTGPVRDLIRSEQYPEGSVIDVAPYRCLWLQSY